ncbi:MAG: hypothetical protein JWP74_905 [Marmoricola sp.]|nr:hypothetical protein [Marmoricola sp.]
MSTTVIQQDPATSATPTYPRLWSAGVGYGLLAAAATTTVAAVLHAAGVSLDVAKEPVPLPAFAEVTFGFALIGLAIAAGLRRWTRDPHRAWLRTTIVLTAFSFVPDLLADAATGTRLTLMATHVAAAAIVVPGVASRLTRR